MESTASRNSQERIAGLLSQFDRYAVDALPHSDPDSLYEPIRYIMSLGGKRLRPLCTLLSHAVYGGNTETVFPAAYAIELFHNFSLVHDDIMDKALMRRGKPSVHNKFGTPTGILSGDVMLVLVFEHLLKYYDGARAIELIKLFSSVAIEVCEGQQMDMDFEHEPEVDLDSYLSMIRKKTAVLLGVAFEAGAMLAGCDHVERKHWSQFGENLGMAFQIEDDILDLYGNRHAVGKTRGGDVIQKKKTILYVHALNTASSDERQLISKKFNDLTISDEQRINWFTQYFQKAGVVSYAKTLGMGIYDKALGELDHLRIDRENRALIEYFAHGLMHRKK